MLSIARQAILKQDQRAVVYLMIFLLCSLPMGFWFTSTGLASSGNDAQGYFVTLNLFIAQDMWLGPIILVLTWATFAWTSETSKAMRSIPHRAIALATLLAVVLTFSMRFLAYHNFSLSLDEFMPLFQAAIFRGGNLLAPLSEEAFAMRDVLQPYFTYSDETHRLWAAHYRPVHAAILSVFPERYEVALAHSILTGITVLAMASIARQVFPDRPGAPLLSVCLLIASPQVLLTAASGFAFTTHLAFNTVWLALFLRGTWTAHFAAAIIGFFALGIHQVHVHAIYVFPFGVAMLLGYFGDRLKALPYVVAYGIGVPFWIAWPEIATWLQTGDVNALPRTLLEVEYLSNYLDRSETIGSDDRQFSAVFLFVNIWRFVLWMSPALALLLALALVSRRPLGEISVIAGLGVLFTILVSHLLLPNQMHTIGSRYYHAIYANLILVAVASYYALEESSRLRRTTAVLLAVGAMILLPVRAWQIHQKVGPRAAIHAQLASLDVDNIVIGSSSVWFMPDFARNDPYLEKGTIYHVERDGVAVEPIGNGTTLRISGADMIEMGLVPGTFLEPAFDP